MKRRSLALPLLLAATLTMTACQSLRISQRGDVKGVPGLTVSQFGPEDEENCEQLERTPCRYWSNPLKTPQAACAEEQGADAVAMGANYMWVNEPKQSVGGFKVRAPIATYYKCEALIED